MRIYSGKADGSFTLERNLSENTNSALAEKTVQSVLGYLGADKGGTRVSASGWQQAYTDLLQSQDSGQWQGYNLIYINDDHIPELVEIGIDEATGCFPLLPDIMGLRITPMCSLMRREIPSTSMNGKVS